MLFFKCMIKTSLNIHLCYFTVSRVLRHLSHSGDLMLWVGVRRRPSCINIFISRTDGPISRVRKQKIVNFMTPSPPKGR